MARSQDLVFKMNAKYVWKDVPIPAQAILTIKEAREAYFKGIHLHVVLPHLLELWSNVHMEDFQLKESTTPHNYLDFKGANLEGRVNYNANFVFTNYWHAYAYLNKFKVT